MGLRWLLPFLLACQATPPVETPGVVDDMASDDDLSTREQPIDPQDLSVVVGPDVPARRFGFGFLGGTMTPNEDQNVSTWNDISFCTFTTPDVLQQLIDSIDTKNRVIIEWGRSWKSANTNCGMSDTTVWGDFTTFKSRFDPLIPTLQKNQSRLGALWVFDEPDAGHKGPSDAELQKGVDYVASLFPTVPVYVNWFHADYNTRLTNVDIYGTTKGADPSALSSYGKPMFLWWFNNEGQPDAAVILGRWNAMLAYHYRSNATPIFALGWCCDAIEKRNSTYDTNSPALYALLQHIGRQEHRFGEHAPAAAAFITNDWMVFDAADDMTLQYTHKSIFPASEALPIGGSSAYNPSSSAEGDAVTLAASFSDGKVYLATRKSDATWSAWAALANFSQAHSRPAVLTRNAVTWVAVRDATGHLFSNLVGSMTWKDLGRTTAHPLLRENAGSFAIVAFRPDGQVYRRPLVDGDPAGEAAWTLEP